VTFDAAVNISVDDLIIRNDTLGGTVVDASGLTLTYNDNTNTAVWDFGSLMLDPAFYSFELSSDIVSAIGNLSLDGNNNGVPGGAFFESVYVALPGDANLDGQVDVLGDALALVGSLGTTGGATFAQGDFNGDGNVTVLGDAIILVGNLGTSVVPPSLATATSQTLVQPTLAAIELTPLVSPTAVIIEQSVEQVEDEDELVAVVPREVANAVSPELTGNQARDAAFESVNLIDYGLF